MQSPLIAWRDGGVKEVTEGLSVLSLNEPPLLQWRGPPPLHSLGDREEQKEKAKNKGSLRSDPQPISTLLRKGVHTLSAGGQRASDGAQALIAAGSRSANSVARSANAVGEGAKKLLNSVTSWLSPGADAATAEEERVEEDRDQVEANKQAMAEAEKREAERVEAERAEEDRAQVEANEQARVEAAKREAERQEAERVKAEREKAAEAERRKAEREKAVEADRAVEELRNAGDDKAIPNEIAEVGLKTFDALSPDAIDENIVKEVFKRVRNDFLSKIDEPHCTIATKKTDQGFTEYYLVSNQRHPGQRGDTYELILDETRQYCACYRRHSDLQEAKWGVEAIAMLRERPYIVYGKHNNVCMTDLQLLPTTTRLKRKWFNKNNFDGFLTPTDLGAT